MASGNGLGGSENVVGTTLTLSEVPYTVVGIMPPGFDVRLLDQAEGAAFWTLLGASDPGYGPDGIGPVAIVARVRAGVTIAAARAEAAAITRRAESVYARNFNQFIVNLSSLQADNTRSVRVTLVTVLAAAICLLLIAAINVGALLLSRGLARRSEVAVRHALGAARARLVRQFLTESFVLSVCGGALGLGVGHRGNAALPGVEPARHAAGQRRAAGLSRAGRGGHRDDADDGRQRPGAGPAGLVGRARRGAPVGWAAGPLDRADSACAEPAAGGAGGGVAGAPGVFSPTGTHVRSASIRAARLRLR